MRNTVKTKLIVNAHIVRKYFHLIEIEIMNRPIMISSVKIGGTYEDCSGIDNFKGLICEFCLEGYVGRLDIYYKQFIQYVIYEYVYIYICLYFK